MSDMVPSDEKTMIFPSLVDVAIVQEGPSREYVRVPVSLELVHRMGKDALWMAFLQAYYTATGQEWRMADKWWLPTCGHYGKEETPGQTWINCSVCRECRERVRPA